ncbi:MAG: NUDIX domain-containing protein [Candidatus Latescibacteria bacterium]|jgi:8-oxo-dGTP diphosphatase|nr:NUDIX domain-containing protein [Candidatus Latescibacterota bacterium]MBT4141321.1 NUDIX domain-containing protein [Candidatus Latescibacterota bacterium]MBT5832776.1 NUDIX domain-containing protein [Candidatus Latescibacterota bacterium]
MQIEVPIHKQMFVNARALIYRIENDTLELLVQTRHRMGQKPVIEFPGGTVETFEPLLEALKREVREETGLELTDIEGQSTRIEIQSNNLTAECVSPYVVYQTIQGFNGMGAFFRCQAEGTLFSEGDGSQNVHWEEVDELIHKLDEDTNQFSVMSAAILTKIKKEGTKRFVLRT